MIGTVSILPLLIESLEKEERNTFRVGPRSQPIVKRFLLILVCRLRPVNTVGRTINACPPCLADVNWLFNIQLCHVIQHRLVLALGVGDRTIHSEPRHRLK